MKFTEKQIFSLAPDELSLIFEALFRAEIAEIVQFISLPLELMGLTLTCIEVFYYRLARKLEKILKVVFAKPYEFLLYLFSLLHEKYSNELDMFKLLVLSSIVGFATMLWVKSFNPELAELLVGGSTILVLFIFFPLTSFILMMIFWLLGHFFDWLRRRTKTRSIGFIGLILGGLGLLGEVYQVITMLVD